MNPLAIAAKGKGFKNALRRSQVITSRYGLTSKKMDNTLVRFARLLEKYEASATFPITAVALKRNSVTIRQLAEQGIEFAIHGHTHIDHSLLTTKEQVARLNQAIALFETSGVPFVGFRCPYLRWNQGTLAALSQHHLLYDSSQGLAWDVLNGNETPAYRHVLKFYGAQSACEYPALPYLNHDGLIRIPYCLPDDEALIDRLHLETTQAKSEVWLRMLQRIHNLGELFTVGLHPERIDLLAQPLAAVLAQARTLLPAVWIARLDEIARWWRDRTNTTISLKALSDSTFHITISGPPGVTVLARNLDVQASTSFWADDYRRVMANTFTISTVLRPFIGISPQSTESLPTFLRQQGYWVEVSEEPKLYPFYVDNPHFNPEDERPLLAQIEQGNWPLLRLGRWPDGARCALCVTGDIDALTLWDYGLRILGN